MNAVTYILISLSAGILFAPVLPAQTSGQSWYGTTADEELGNACTIFGDADGDGIDDFAFSAFRADTNGIDSGRVVMISGATHQVLFEFVGDSAYDYLGVDLAAAGDVDNDGRADIIVDANQWQTGLGYVRVYSGRDGSILHEFLGTTVEEHFATVGGAGDIDDDGHDDLILGIDNADTSNGLATGLVRIHSGATGNTLYTFLGDNPGDEFGQTVISAGDVNADDRPDILIGATHFYTPGYIRVFSGFDGSELRTIASPGGLGADRFGESLCGPGDLNGDGFDDFLIGDSHYMGPHLPYQGRVMAYSGRTGNLLFDALGSTHTQYFGRSLSSVGDANLDGTPDFLVGTYPYAAHNGYVNLCSGVDGGELFRINSQEDYESFSASLSGTGDTNGDGWNDILVGAPYDSTNATHAGEVRLITGFLLMRPLTPGLAGTANDVEVIRATPGDRIHFAAGKSGGITAIPGCPGLSVAIANAQHIGTVTAQASGRALLTAMVPARASGSTIVLQAVERSHCLVSSRIVYIFP